LREQLVSISDPNRVPADGPAAGQSGRSDKRQFRVQRLLPDDYRLKGIAADLLRGLTKKLPELYPKWCYDPTGSEIYEKITSQPEYYLTDCEWRILNSYSSEISDVANASTLIELGSGVSKKTVRLLEMIHQRGTLNTFIPFDVDETALVRASKKLLLEHPTLDIRLLVADFERHISSLPRSNSRTTIALLGSTIGNFYPTARLAILRSIASWMQEDDVLLIGADLIKAERRMVNAYSDSAGANESFAKHALHVINSEIGANFDTTSFTYEVAWNPIEHWVEMFLVSQQSQSVVIPTLDLHLEWPAGSRIRTEISTKFTNEFLNAELSAAGFTVTNRWFDGGSDFVLLAACLDSTMTADSGR